MIATCGSLRLITTTGWPVCLTFSNISLEGSLLKRPPACERAPYKTTCQRCGQPLLFLIFGDHATDAAGLDAYGRLLEQPIRQHGLPAYVLGQPNGAGDDVVSLLRCVWPDAGEVVEMTPNRPDAFVAALSAGHGCGAGIG